MKSLNVAFSDAVTAWIRLLSLRNCFLFMVSLFPVLQPLMEHIPFQEDFHTSAQFCIPFHSVNVNPFQVSAYSHINAPFSEPMD